MHHSQVVWNLPTNFTSTWFFNLSSFGITPRNCSQKTPYVASKSRALKKSEAKINWSHFLFNLEGKNCKCRILFYSHLTFKQQWLSRKCPRYYLGLSPDQSSLVVYLDDVFQAKGFCKFDSWQCSKSWSFISVHDNFKQNVKNYKIITYIHVVIINSWLARPNAIMGCSTIFPG